MNLRKIIRKIFQFLLSPSSKYDEKGRMIYHRFSDGTFEGFSYNDKGQLTHYYNSEHQWQHYVYDSNGNIIFYEDESGNWDYDFRTPAHHLLNEIQEDKPIEILPKLKLF